MNVCNMYTLSSHQYFIYLFLSLLGLTTPRARQPVKPDAWVRQGRLCARQRSKPDGHFPQGKHCNLIWPVNDNKQNTSDRANPL